MTKQGIINALQDAGNAKGIKKLGLILRAARKEKALMEM